MKIFLQDCKTLKFMRCDSLWSADIHEALDFISIRRATVYVLKELKGAYQLAQVEADGLQTLATIKIVTVPRPTRVAREILRRVRPSQNLRLAGQVPPPILSVHAGAL